MIQEAYLKDESRYITIHDYLDKTHYNNIVCPECKKAPIHIVKRQKVTYFASNRKDKHSKDCQHYAEFISNKNIMKLIDSKDIKDNERLKFLITSNLNSALRLLFKKNVQNLDSSTTNKVNQNKSGNPQKSNTYKKESIQRTHIKNISKNKSELINQYIIIYGEASIDSKEVNRVNGTTQERFKVKNIYFKLNNTLCFSISLSGQKLKDYTELNENSSLKKFAAFGLLLENKGFLNLIIKDIENIKYS